MFRYDLSTCLFVVFVGFATNALAADGSSVDFRRDIRPLLSDACFHCHGPDEATREAGLRLDLEDAAKENAIVEGDPDASELMERILTDDPDLVMPPPDSGKSLTRQRIELIRRWIADGARYQTHWAFAPPVRPAVPVIDSPDWVQNPIDAFVIQRLRREGMSPSPRADTTTLVRRLYLDLIGLPPTPDQIDDCLARPGDWYASLAHQLLDSPHYGERWGRIWLDAARYADSNGYEKDAPRETWFYRDWVIDALNADMPYDQFIIQQVAGDLLVEESDSPLQRQALLVATGFLRNSMINEEGGADPEQFRMEAMYDRMDVIGKSVLGLTVQCGQCHSHKYDPLSQEDYYRMFAFLNSTHDAIIPVYTPDQQNQRERVRTRIAAIHSELKQQVPDWADEMAKWEASAGAVRYDWQVLKPVKLPFEGTKFRVLDDFSILSESFAPKSAAPEFSFHTEAEGITGFRLELLTHPQLPRGGPGRSQRGTAALSEMTIFVAPMDDPDKRTKLKLVKAVADVNPARAEQPKYLRDVNAKDGDARVIGPAEFSIDGDNKTAWTTDIDPGRRNQSRQIVFIPESPLGFPQGTVVTFKAAMHHGGWNNNDNHNCLIGRARFSLTTDADPTAEPLPGRIREILQVPRSERSSQQHAAVFGHWITTVPSFAEATERIDLLWKDYPEGTTQFVLQQQSKPRVTSLLERGDFLKPVREVQPGVPSFLHPPAEPSDPSRLSFARWLVDARGPTTARSLVNRLWQSYFGIGLVETSDDLGTQSMPPSHPELLDWLAVELVESGWSIKHLHRLIIGSATYQQSSHADPEQFARDPHNRLLSRGARFRVDAEIVRDIALAASGLLDPKIGGPSVNPPAPDFLFQPPASYGQKTWHEAKGSSRYRRALYTFRFRSVPYPMLEAFDATPGVVSCVRRTRSNTPLQSLTMMNEPVFVECARALAAITLAEGGADDADRIAYAMRRCVARSPTEDEARTLLDMLGKQRSRLTAGQLDAEAIAGQGSSAEHAAWTLLARVLLNLDETITKE